MDKQVVRPYPRKRSAINISLNNLIKSVICDRPCSEGYEVKNLISKNISERNKGFLVERFIKPPVTLTFEFSCTIDIRYVMVQCNVGAQKSSGIDLSIQPHSSEKQFESLCSGVLKGNEKGFVFHRYSEDVRAKFGGDMHFCFFKSNRNLSHVSSLRIKIFRTQDASVPALGKVDIWGVPQKGFPQTDNISRPTSTSTSIAKSTDIINLTHSNASLETKLKKPNLDVNCDSRSQSSRRGWSESLEIPDDFIDPITCELMCQPVTLPSGKVIDASTLESHEKAESQWGRGASDPFTGVLFTSSSKPVAASDLKARIDKFLCDNSDHPELKTVPRTVGRRFMVSRNSDMKPSISKLITDKVQITSCSVTNDFSSSIRSNCEILVKRRKVEENKSEGCRFQASLKKGPAPARPESVRTSQFPTRNESSALSFQERMEKSLELSLKHTLSSLPSFTADEKECDEKPQVECNICKLCDSLFSIPCCHFICRKCLISSKAKDLLSCQLCQTPFKSHDVQKVHLSK